MTLFGRVRLPFALVAVAVFALPLTIGCDHPKSECDDDSDCPGEELCLSVADRPAAPPLSVDSDELDVPASSAHYEPIEAIEVTVSPSTLKVNGTKVTDVPSDYDLNADDEEGGTAPLRDALVEAREKREKETALLDQTYVARVVVTADQATPNRVIFAVLEAAEVTGFSDIRFATRRVDRQEVWRD